MKVCDALGPARSAAVTLASGQRVHVRELTLAESYPYLFDDKPLDPDAMIRLCVTDGAGKRLVGDEESIPLSVARELLPHLIAINNLDVNVSAAVDDLEAQFSPAASSG